MGQTVLQIISVVGVISSVLFAYLAFSRNKGADRQAAGEQDGAMMAELGYIKSGVDDIKREQQEQRAKNLEVVERLTAVEQSAKQAHHRIDRLEGVKGKDGT